MVCIRQLYEIAGSEIVALWRGAGEHARADAPERGVEFTGYCMAAIRAGAELMLDSEKRLTWEANVIGCCEMSDI